MSCLSFHASSLSKYSFLSISLSHGKNPKWGEYLYVYLPEATPEETSAYAQNPDIVVIAQNDYVHAVRENSLGITGYAFYERYDVDGISVSDPCAVMIADYEGTLTLSVSDPTHNLTSLTVTVTGRNLSSCVSNDCGAAVTFSGNGDAVIVFDVSGNVGNTFTLKLN